MASPDGDRDVRRATRNDGAFFSHLSIIDLRSYCSYTQNKLLWLVS